MVDPIDQDHCKDCSEVLSGDEIMSGETGASQVSSGASHDGGNLVLLGRAEQAEIGRKLRELYEWVAAEPLPTDIANAMARLEQRLRNMHNV
jgi:hypothetical protein